MSARRSQPSLTAAGVLSGVVAVMRPNALRIIFGLLLGIFAAFVIGSLPPSVSPKATVPSSAFAVRFSPAVPGWIIAR